MKQLLFLFFFSVFTLQFNYAQTEESDNRFGYNKNKPARQEWLRDAGFGMFVHFNIDAQLGITISHSLVGASEDYVNRYFNDLPKSFDPYKFNAYEIAKLAKLAGMKYIVFTTKHHSGFCFWNTKTTRFNIMNTAYGKDLLKEYVAGVRKAGLAVGFYFSPEDFNFLHENKILIKRGDMNIGAPAMKKYEDLIRKQTTELFTNYGKVDVLFIDGEPKDPCKEVAWKLQPDVVITRGAVNTPEQTLPGVALDQFWESCITMGTQWNYKPTNDHIKTGGRLIELLIEARAKGGNFLLNVGPHPDGNIPYEQEAPLREVAAWNFVNYEAIQGVRPWIVVREENIWFTADKNKQTVYAIITGIPEWRHGARKDFVLASVKASSNTRISVLGQNDQVAEYQNNVNVQSKFEQKEDGLHISIARAQRMYDDYKWPNPITVKLEHVEPALEPPVIETLQSLKSDAGVTLKGRLVKKGNADKVKVGFQFRPYGGFAENLTTNPWSDTKFVDMSQEAEYEVMLPDVKGGTEYQYRAVVIHPRMTVHGDIRRFTLRN